MARPQPTVDLTGDHVRLEPLARDHVDALVRAASGERSTYGMTWVPADRAAMAGYVEGLLADHAAGHVLPFAQRRRSTDELVGCTRFMELRHWRGRPEPDEVEIGGTWLSADAQRTAINTEAKLLLLTHAFEHWGVWRVALCTDVRNERSRRAIERLGARLDGVLRHHRPRADADPVRPRDSALYSITDDDWPDVRRHLRQLLGATG